MSDRITDDDYRPIPAAPGRPVRLVPVYGHARAQLRLEAGRYFVLPDDAGGYAVVRVSHRGRHVCATFDDMATAQLYRRACRDALTRAAEALEE